MLSVQEARTQILNQCNHSKIIELSIMEAGGFVLAEPVISEIDFPHFNQSAMDGYAFLFNDWDGVSALQISGEVQTGNSFSGELQTGTAIRIFTGAVLPNDADTVVIQENVIKNGLQLIITDKNLKKGSNVRLTGSQTKKGEEVLNEGHMLTPASISFLAGLGIRQVKVYANPTVRILTTGKELIKAGEPLENGKIYESNSFGLRAALHQMGLAPASVETVDDDEKKIKNAIERGLETDILIITGGVSVGDYDFVATALEQCGVKKIFHKVKQKPGKPFYFGVHQQTLVFALPGNPASVLTCFYEYVADAIGKFTKRDYFKRAEMLLANDCSKKPGLTLFLKGKIQTGVVSVLNHQESYKMNSFAVADCIIELEEEKEFYKETEKVIVRMLF